MTPASQRASNAEQLDVSSQPHRERLEVCGIGRHDVVAIVGEYHERSVDDVNAAFARKETARRSSEALVERTDVDARQRSRE